MNEPPPYIERLIKRLSDADPAWRVEACRALGAHRVDSAPALNALVAALEDDSVHTWAGNATFDGDWSEFIDIVANEAINTLARVAPARPPPDRVAAAIARLWGRTVRREHCTYDSPLDVSLTWSAESLACFGEPLRQALRELAAGDGPLSERAREAVRALGWGGG